MAATKSKREKMEKKFDDTFVSETRSKTESQLKESLLGYMKEVKKNEDLKKEDATLNALKEQLADLNGGYSDTKKAITDKMNYIFELMKERGTF